MKRRTQRQWQARLILIVLALLAAVVLADQAGLKNHP